MATKKIQRHDTESTITPPIAGAEDRPGRDADDPLVERRHDHACRAAWRPGPRSATPLVAPLSGQPGHRAASPYVTQLPPLGAFGFVVPDRPDRCATRKNTL
jgi:hypothetical protein